MKRTRFLFKHILFLHVCALLMLSLLRLTLYCAGRSFLAEASRGDVLLQSMAFLRGVWFDNVVTCYIVAVPLLATIVCSICGYAGKWILTPVTRWMQVFTIMLMGFSAGNIPYFLYFFKNINSSIWNWAEYGTTTIGMVFGEPSYYPPMVGFLILAVCYLIWSERWLNNRMEEVDSVAQTTGWMPRVASLLLGIVCGGLCFLGIRGRLGYNPIKVSAAYYCEDAFLNQLGINPAFNLLTSTLDDRRPENRELHLMDKNTALQNVMAYLGRNDSDQTPLAYELPAGQANGSNVVMILMESMSANLMGKGQTPFLDSLATVGTYFPRCYSAGNHTNHGIFSTLYSYPALMFRNLMKGTNIPKYEGLPTVLQQNGYRTLFFMTHESQYDNMNAFLRTNGFDEIYSQEDYPREKIANSFGVQDDYLFEYANNRLKEVSTPFFATLLTISNHPPYIVPEWFKANSVEKDLQIVEYADESIRRFFAEARKQTWFKNTTFVLLGDHGKLVGEPENEMPECLNHIPLIIFQPGQKSEVCNNWTMQLDIQPTLLSMLGIGARQENFGTNTVVHQRPCAFYTADNVIGARDEQHLYIYNPSTQQEFMYLDGHLTSEKDKDFGELQRYLFSMLQTAQEEIKKHQ